MPTDDDSIGLGEQLCPVCGQWTREGWEKVSERLPKEPGDYLVYGETIGVGMAYFSTFKAFLGRQQTWITHWMLLPEPPQK